jgi:hypothetical protein
MGAVNMAVQHCVQIVPGRSVEHFTEPLHRRNRLQASRHEEGKAEDAGIDSTYTTPTLRLHQP